MQSDVRHVLLPSENAAWPYTESTCVNSQLHFLSSFHLIFPSFPSFPLCARVQQAQADAWLLCVGRTRDIRGAPYEARGRNVRETKGHGRWRRAERMDKCWEHAGLAHEEGGGSTQGPLRPRWSNGRWRQARCRMHLSPTEHTDALSRAGLPQDRAGGRTCWLGLAQVLPLCRT